MRRVIHLHVLLLAICPGLAKAQDAPLDWRGFYFGGSGVIVPMRYAAEQAELLLQASYRFDAEPPPTLK